MTLVVADSGPIRYLVVLGAISFLPRIYDRIVLPGEVVSELRHANAPPGVRAWAAALPDWIEVREPSTEPAASLTEFLDRGEIAAITLAQELSADLVLIDEREARKSAVAVGLRIAGTVGILEALARKDLIGLKEYLAKLRQTNFRINQDLVRQALDRDAAWKKLR